MQSDELASLPVGTEVSAKYKGAFCEAKVKKVHRQVKCKVTFKQGLGSFMLCDSLLTYNGPLVANITVEAKHPERGTVQEAQVNKIYDQSQYTVVFDDGDIATLRRNALCMKSGKHFNASESLDNLPLTHPEHFGTPVGSRRRRFGEEYEEEEEDDDSSDDEAESVPYISKLGTVVCVEVSDKKSTKSRENWFPGLVVSPHSQDQVKINTKEDFLIRSFKDHRYYTVPKKECKKFHKDTGKGVTEAALSKAVQHALAYLDNNENLPVHWDREILFDMRDDSSTEGSSDDEELLLSDDEDVQSPEEKDHLVAELYKHMEDKGTPINKTPSIGDKDIDLYKLFRLVQKLRGQQQVTNNNQWRTVAKKLGFETNWCVNQVRVCYKRYLHSFEELYRTLRCTLNNHPRNSLRVRHGSGRPLARGVRSGSKIKEEDISDRSSVSSQDSGEVNIKREIKEEIFDEIELEGVNKKLDFDEKKVKKGLNVVDKIIKEEPVDEEMEIFDQSKKGKDTKGSGKKGKEDIRMLTRPRRDSSSSLAAATELKAKKDEIGEPSKIKKEPKPKKIKEEDDRSDSGSNGGKVSKAKKNVKKKEEEPVQIDFPEDECSSDIDTSLKKKKANKKKGGKAAELAPVEPPCGSGDGEEPQHLKPSVECAPSDKIKVFWLHGQIYEAKIIKVEKLDIDKWPKFYVHYQGWNQRYDEWITRGRIAENLTWNANPLKQKSSKSATPPPEKLKGKSEKIEKHFSEDEEKPDSEDKTVSEEEKEMEAKKKVKKAKSSTPTSTPSSSRTSSPANNRRTKSPAPKRANSPIVKERTPIKDKKKEIVKRTNSPAQRKSPQLKRQSSRNSLFKQSDDDFEDISDIEEEIEVPRRSARGEKETVDVKVETPKRTSRSGSNVRTEQKTEKVSEAEDEEEKKVEIARSSARLKGPCTPTRKNNKSSDSDDPYVFQEPEPLESPLKSETPGSPDNMEDDDLDSSRKDDLKDVDDSFLMLDESLNKNEDDVNEEIEKLEEDSSDPPEEVMQILTPVKDIEAEDDYENDEPMYHEMEIDDMEEEDLALELNPELIVKDYKDDEEEPEEADIKQERAETDKGVKPVLQLNDRYASLFPHLASLRAVSTTSSTITTQNTISSSSDTSISSIQITSANIISSIVESSILKETNISAENKSSPSLSEVKSEDSEKEKICEDEPIIALKEEQKEEDKKEIKLFKESQTPTKPRTRNKKSKKVRSLRNPTHKSREVVTDSDTDSDIEKPKIKPITPRRKTIENERIKTPLKRLKQMDSDDECSLLKRMKKRKDDDDESLVCQETIPGSPVHSGANESPSKVNPARDERNSSSRLEMPFASVPESVGLPKVNQPTNPISATVQTTLPNPESPPATPESSNSVEGPVITQPKEDGSKSPAESSEVDMESLSGRGKAGSEDSRLDVECSSSSDTRLGRGRRRQPTQRETEKELEQSPQTFKRKRKTRVDNAGRGRGKGRGRNSSGVGRGVGRQMEDTDDSERDTRSEDPRLDRLDNAALAALAHPKPNATSKYNFYVQLNPNMDQTERISKLQRTLEELRKTYLNVKGDLSAIERRRKKIRRKERERTQISTEVAA